MSVAPATTSRAPSDDAAPDQLVAAEQQQREADAPERLGRDERGDDGDAAAVVRLEERHVREAEQDADAEEGRGVPRPGHAAKPRREHEREQERPAEERGGGRDRGRRRRPLRKPADEVVARREEDGDDERVDEADHADVLRPPALARELDAARDDQDRADEERYVRGLPEQDESDHDRDERRRPEHHRDPGRARLPDRERHEQLPEPGLQQPGEQEGPGPARVDAPRRELGRGRDERDGERADDRGERREGRVRAPREPEPEADAHRPEEQRRDEGERDRGHGRGRYPSGGAAPSA